MPSLFIFTRISHVARPSIDVWGIDPRLWISEGLGSWRPPTVMTTLVCSDLLPLQKLFCPEARRKSLFLGFSLLRKKLPFAINPIKDALSQQRSHQWIIRGPLRGAAARAVQRQGRLAALRRMVFAVSITSWSWLSLYKLSQMCTSECGVLFLFAFIF